ncbi:MAG TPA: glycosyltransferase family 4 protein [Patescibacteria group bacterium]|nr:glycosyltransferase family 4 protein [Patescibacteria group bacterium]
MRAAIHNPYLDTLGGGERYTLSFAKVLVSLGYEVDLEWKSPEIIKKLEDRFGLDLAGVRVRNDVNRGDGYDLCFWVSDGSIPTLKSRKNILHFQFPFQNVNGRSLLNKMKLYRIENIIVNSEFTKKFIDSEYGVDSIVVYPPVDTLAIKPKRKENIILYVGRFSHLTQSKRQDVLVDNFKKLTDSGLKDWKLILAGGTEVGVDEYFNELKDMAEGYPVELITSPSFKDLKDLYGKSRIFWSASGFGEDPVKNPTKVEHFGINVVEAMAAGAVPIIYNAGGHTEIIQNNKNGYLWDVEQKLIEITNKLIKDKSLLRKLSFSAINDSKKFSYENFESNINKIL